MLHLRSLYFYTRLRTARAITISYHSPASLLPGIRGSVVQSEGRRCKRFGGSSVGYSTSTQTPGGNRMEVVSTEEACPGMFLFFFSKGEIGRWL